MCVAGLFYVARLGALFKGGALAGAFLYFIAAAVFFTAAFAVKVALDISGGPQFVGYGIRDIVVIVGVVLLALGMRQITQVWPRR